MLSDYAFRAKALVGKVSALRSRMIGRGKGRRSIVSFMLSTSCIYPTSAEVRSSGPREADSVNSYPFLAYKLMRQ